MKTKIKLLLTIAVTLLITLACIAIGHVRVKNITEVSKRNPSEHVQVVPTPHGTFLIVTHTDSTTFVQRISDKDTL